MKDGMDHSKFSWRHEGSEEHPNRLVPHIDGEPSFLSYLRMVSVKRWCDEQFGPDLVTVDSRFLEFKNATDLVLFATLWSGTPIQRATVEEVTYTKI